MESLSKEAKMLWDKLMKGVNVKPLHKNPKNVRTRKMLDRIKQIAWKNKESVKVSFGTSGWRGLVGESHTIQNVLRVTEGIVAMVKNGNKSLLKAVGVKDFEEFKKRGVVVGRDNRIMGKEFVSAVIGILQKHGIKVFFADETPTPEYATAVIQLNAALSINLTPSHNPGCYSGYKVNPSDGGPAGENITNAIEKYANSYMDRIIKPVNPDWKKVKKIDSAKLYLRQIRKKIKHIVDVNKIIKFIKSKKISLAIDHIHGSTRGRPKAFLKLTGRESNVSIIHNDDNVLFHGVKPEPSSKNMKVAEKWLKKQKTEFKLGVLMDPDGDRIRFTNGKVQVDMNNFGALAFHFLAVHKKIKGGVAKTVATSNFVNAIASGLNRKIMETNVGFKYFRPYLKEGTRQPVVCAFEESDGFSIGYANILEKDAFGALMLAIEMIRVTGKDISVYLQEVKKEFGIFNAIKDALEVSPSLTKEEKSRKVNNIGKNFKIGVRIVNIKKKIKNILPDDGIKIEFTDSSNLLIRQSGTEPIIKVYSESPVSIDDTTKILDYGMTVVKKEFK